MNKRCKQVSSELQHQLSQLLVKNIELPIDCLVTITKVEINADLKIAKVYITVLPENKNQIILTQLKKSTNLIQKELRPKTRFYTIPKLEFLIDEGEIKRRQVSQILDNLKK